MGYFPNKTTSGTSILPGGEGGGELLTLRRGGRGNPRKGENSFCNFRKRVCGFVWVVPQLNFVFKKERGGEGKRQREKGESTRG